ncbi:MAG: hypothetical protein Q4E62_08855 [Sutterellaceae bacterium]|nr:hypothetical protein [Sutterellaceae bacterium]
MTLFRKPLFTDYEVNWTPMSEGKPTDTRSYYLITMWANGGRYVTADRWTQQGVFEAAHGWRQEVLAWHQIVKPFVGMGYFSNGNTLRWRTRNEIDLIEGGAVFVFNGDELRVVSWRDVVATKLDFWADKPMPYDPGDGSPWTRSLMPGDDGPAWKLRDRQLNRDWYDKTKGDFGRALNRACRGQINNAQLFVEVMLPNGEKHQILKTEIVESCTFDSEDWNRYPQVEPPEEALKHKMPFRVEYKENGRLKGGRFFFDGQHFFDDEVVLVEPHEKAVNFADRKAKVAKVLEFAFWRV